MTGEVARLLNEVNATFYRTQANSFSRTRRDPWPGWERCLAEAGLDGRDAPARTAHGADGPAATPAPGRLSVLDVGCGNLRLATFLAGRLPGQHVDYVGVDSCPALARDARASEAWQTRLVRRDVVGELLDAAAGSPTGDGGDGPAKDGPGAAASGSEAATHGARRAAFDLVACFGLLHHVPTATARALLVRELVLRCAAGGVACVSLWQFALDGRRLERARATTGRACADLGLSPDALDPGDFLLGWEGRPHVWRYCHSFGDDEARELVGGVSDLALARASFRPQAGADRLNRYLVLERRAS